MPSTISAGTTSGTAIVVAGDTSGELQLRTNGTTSAMTIDTGQRVGIGTTTPVSYSGTLAVVNGDASGWRGSFGTTTTGVLLGIRSSTASIGAVGATKLALNPDGGGVCFNTTTDLRSFNFNGNEISWFTTSGTIAYLNLSNSSGNNGNTYALVIRGLGSGGSAQNDLSYITLAATNTYVNTLSKSGGSFRISHPLPELNKTHDLVHSFVESPDANNIYRGVVNLVNGQAIVNLDEAARMTEGTFVLLNRETQAFVSNQSDWDAVKAKVEGNILTIQCQNPQSTASISWLVIGMRQDKYMFDTDWTDDNGYVITEPLKRQVPEGNLPPQEGDK